MSNYFFIIRQKGIDKRCIVLYISAMSEYLTTIEVMQELKVTYTTVWRWIKAGKLTAYRVGGVLRVKREDLEKFLTKRSSKG